jgi:thymidylate synthase
MRQYLDLVKKILREGDMRGDRTGSGALSIFGYQMRFDLAEGFPLVTTRKIFIRHAIHEILWFLRGDSNIGYLQENGVHIWDDWAIGSGSVGPMYGSQWRNFDFQGIDQINDLLVSLQHRPFSRRHVVSAWNPAVLPDEAYSPQANVERGRMALAPCHALFQFYVSSSGKLSCQLYQRSADVMVGLPTNLAGYALLTHMIAQQLDMQVGELIWTGGDTHIYLNHQDGARRQLSREPHSLPQLRIVRRPASLFEYEASDFDLSGYDPHPVIKYEIAV